MFDFRFCLLLFSNLKFNRERTWIKIFVPIPRRPRRSASESEKKKRKVDWKLRKEKIRIELKKKIKVEVHNHIHVTVATMLRHLAGSLKLILRPLSVRRRQNPSPVKPSENFDEVYRIRKTGVVSSRSSWAYSSEVTSDFGIDRKCV